MQQTRKYGNWPLSKIKARFEMLDRAYQETKKLGRLKTRKEMDPGNFREKDGILVHIDDRGKPVFGGNGFHRLSISKALQLEKIPACVGMVDKGAKIGRASCREREKDNTDDRDVNDES